MQATPTAAESICSALVRPGLATLAVGDDVVAQPTLQQPLDTGAVAVLVPDDGTLHAALDAADDTNPGHTPTALLEVTDSIVLSHDKPVRSVTWIAGSIERMNPACQRRIAAPISESRPYPGLLDIGHGASLVLLWPTSAVLADTHGIEVVDSADLAAARPDPFCILEDAWLSHLEDSHGDLLARLARRLPAELRHMSARPISIDRFGITLRVADTGHSTDVRMPFGRVARDPGELGRAVRALAWCPHPAGALPVR